MKRTFHTLLAVAAGLLAGLGQRLNEAIFGHMARAGLISFVTLPTKAGAVTLFDIAQGMDPNGRPARTINLLTQTNEMLRDMSFMPGNLPTGHKSTILTGLPVPIWRKLYQGVPPSKATRASVTDAIGMLEARAEVDVQAYKLNANSQAWRLQQNAPFLEAMNQNAAETVIYGDSSVNPERFTGFTPRFSSLSAGNAGNIIDAGGTGVDNTSVWLVVWGENTVSGIYPVGSDAGLEHEDLGIYDALDELGNRYRAYGDLWMWKLGLTVADWRYIVRIANIDVSDLIGQTGTQAPTAATALSKLMIRAQALIPNPGMGNAVFYGNRTVKSLMAVAALDRSQNALSITAAANQYGAVRPGGVQQDLVFLGTPFRTVDRILNTEARVI